MKTPEHNSSDPKEHTAVLKSQLEEIKNHFRADIEKVAEPQAKAIFEVCAEVIQGLQKALSDYESKNESAWK